MSEPEPSFETRLESMERRLAEIQQELAPEAPQPPAPEAPPAPEPPPEPIPLRPRAAPRPPETPAIEVDVTAGPFADTAALREFERALAGLPGVRDVTVRGYTRGNRAILEVQLERQTS